MSFELYTLYMWYLIKMLAKKYIIKKITWESKTDGNIGVRTEC